MLIEVASTCLSTLPPKLKLLSSHSPRPQLWPQHVTRPKPQDSGRLENRSMSGPSRKLTKTAARDNQWLSSLLAAGCSVADDGERERAAEWQREISRSAQSRQGVESEAGSTPWGLRLAGHRDRDQDETEVDQPDEHDRSCDDHRRGHQHPHQLVVLLRVRLRVLWRDAIRSPSGHPREWPSCVSVFPNRERV